MEATKTWKILFNVGSTLTVALACSPASAAYNATIQGTVAWVEQMAPGSGYSAGTIRFLLDNQPNINCGGWNNFVISSGYIAEESTRRNMLAILLAAKSSGSQVVVAYDSNGTGCDQGSPVVYYLRML